MGVEYTPRVIVKFIDVPYDSESLQYDVKRYLDQAAWAELRTRFDGLPALPERLFKAVTPQRIREMAEEASQKRRNRHLYSRSRNFLTYFEVPCPDEETAHAIAKAMSGMSRVERAYVAAGPAPPPAVDPSDDPLWPQDQQHHSAAPVGVNSEHAWGITGGDGGGVQADIRFCDVEQGWDRNHRDVPATQLLHGSNAAYFDHGTNVLCVVVGRDNAADGIGIVPNVKYITVSSILPGYRREDAYKAAAATLKEGDVLLLEDQLPIGPGNFPVESELALFDVIEETTGRGITVIEAAGNGPIDLDDFTPGWGQSGAIMVAAATVLDRRGGGGAPPRTRESSTNFGQHRIDCYAWGEQVGTRHDASGNVIVFNQTSAASAIIAGVALALQGIKKANAGTPFWPEELRAHVKNWTNGTVSWNSAENAVDWNRDKIGVMPDLKKLTINLNLAPDLYIRDNVADNGSPHSGSVASSPDVILRDTRFDPIPDTDRLAAQAAYGEGSGTESNSTLSVTPVQGKDHYIYLRVRNRGGAGAETVQGTVYWSEVATLVTPDRWNAIGSTVIPQVQRGDVLTVSSSVVWPGVQIPAPGHYCFVAIIGNSADPQPKPGDFTNWDAFVKFIRENNNVTWRNFSVVEYPLTNSPDVPLVFNIAGAWDQARTMRLEVDAQLPHGSTIKLEAPVETEEILNGFSSIAPVEREELKPIAWVRLNPQGRSSGGEVQFPIGFRAKCQLRITIPKEFWNDTYEVYIRQVWEKIEVGRVTWRLKPKN